ncbi:unnamed protein product [Urochloa humidicola]
MLTTIMSAATRRPFLSLLLFLLAAVSCAATAAVPESTTARSIRRVNRHGPFLGVVVPNAFEMEPLLRSPRFSPARGRLPPYLDVAGRRFRLGTIGEQKVVIVMTGLGMLTAVVS